MKPAFEHTPLGPWESFHCEVVRGPNYNATWHFHPEFQLTLVLQSAGYRLVGDNITVLKPGDLVLLGANLPHVWHQEPVQADSQTAVHAIILRFLDTFLGRDFLEVPEARPVRRLLKRARRGLQVVGNTRKVLAGQIQQIAQLKGLHRVAALLSILETLAHSDDVRPVASAGFAPSLTREDQGRVERVIAFIHDHLGEPIDRAAVAAQAHLSVSAFSRFFKLRIGKTLPQYVNELRIGRACGLLADERLKIANVAMDCGFQNLAHFNRCFRESTGLNPRDYRFKLRGSST
ncbi:MAG TPA: AraC family transcriptional regulator [Clostridia bacterium]|nr:AraC family transcriptional regulator [Clostridia bacterium]